MVSWTGDTDTDTEIQMYDSWSGNQMVLSPCDAVVVSVRRFYRTATGTRIDDVQHRPHPSEVPLENVCTARLCIRILVLAFMIDLVPSGRTEPHQRCRLCLAGRRVDLDSAPFQNLSQHRLLFILPLLYQRRQLLMIS